MERSDFAIIKAHNFPTFIGSGEDPKKVVCEDCEAKLHIEHFVGGDGYLRLRFASPLPPKTCAVQA